MANTQPDRRPLKSRDTTWARTISKMLAHTRITPNQISVGSVFFAAIGGFSFVAAGFADGGMAAVFLFLGAAGIQLRLLCNMLDGMVATERGMRSKVGEIYNEFPDRIADAIILVCAGYSSHWLSWTAELGWAAAAGALITAYVRALGVAAGASQQFCGPMAKPHRMAALTVATLLAIVEVLLHQTDNIIAIALMVIILGCVVTTIRRTTRILRELSAK